ncbi:PAS/PAC sensor hybrid histidine kinase [Caballeronia calidae]|uniref:histidine kinase n=1 Tax=Caballeronia calidae TaxID=1777139 RepID=A0A158DD73_9BURK|nr:hybrid sensor histidine kinase/response regulator [Caballeronia calidae]SAK91757.1 PAS/PAC sensor hybrid histidine kinase [Caballeronia calidae]
MQEPSEISIVERTQRAGALITSELDSRSRRAPDYAAESAALHALAKAFTTSPSAMLQTLADTALALCRASSAGISLREHQPGQPESFRWIAVSGRCAQFVGHVIPTDESPAGVALSLGAPQLIAFPKQHFPCLSVVEPGIFEELVVPVPGAAAPRGALWVISHDAGVQFDSEHRRILTSLADFACAALSVADAKASAEARADEAEAARSSLLQAEADKDNFIATLAHELRCPLAPIDTALEVAQKLAAENPAVLSALALAHRQVQQIKRLVSDLLDASRVRHGKLCVNLDYCLIGDIVKDAIAAVGEDARRRRQHLRATLPPYPVTVYADSARLTQIVCNVLSNAVKYTPRGGEISFLVEAPDPDVLVGDELSRWDVVISVTDTGIGIAQDLLPQVFELYAQSPYLGTRADGGLGLGLSVVKYLVQAHHGIVTIASDGEGKGTCVKMRLPIVCKSGNGHSAPTTHGIPPARILLVDDSCDATEALSMLLALDGHEVRRAQCGSEALAIVESFTPDVALIDVHMPGMDGPTLAGLLKQHPQCTMTRLVALTGDTAPTERQDAVFDCYLVKPPALEDLKHVLQVEQPPRPPADST